MPVPQPPEAAVHPDDQHTGCRGKPRPGKRRALTGQRESWVELIALTVDTLRVALTAYLALHPVRPAHASARAKAFSNHDPRACTYSVVVVAVSAR